MTKITYYDMKKEYTPMKFNSPEAFCSVQLIRMQNELGFTIDSDVVTNIENPTLYVCGKQGFIRINRYTFYKVDIPDELRPMLRHCKNIEMLVTSSSSQSFVSFYPLVERVLRFPELLSILDKEDDDEKKCVGDSPDLASNSDEDIEEEKKVKPIPARPIFEHWFNEIGQKIICEYKKKDVEFLLASDGRHLLLVSFFDRDWINWLADEELFCNEAPLWFSVFGHVCSPVYSTGLAVKFLNATKKLNLIPLVILGDHINILNAEDIQEQWSKIGANVCYCTREETEITSMSNLFRLVAQKDTPVPDENVIQIAKDALEQYDSETAEAWLAYQNP